ncbi:hypothetical protein CV770_22765 [Bradyrhizobium sp. AC87j1]|uniref:hypothetical protein n=1 Tax=Bradyrhizobium sp. AC87j1 TaxID=2055894 RepID=UPI000CEBD9F6|nr:hypothetical protein [Bradyrhizobium sp. AC87j1]PPQ17080.1 hypothetical protein CV770_22765 [Bradyrhizobium sp. AC87j1]
MLRDQSSDRAKREANKAFKPVKTQKPMTDYAKDQHSLNENRERLKAERLAREAKSKELLEKGLPE